MPNNIGAFGENFPYTNQHDMNMDWVIKIAKDFLDQYSTLRQTIDNGLEELENKATELEGLLDRWYETHSNDIETQLQEALTELNNWYVQHQNYLDEILQTNITAFDTHAEEKALETIASIPSDYTALSNMVNTINNYNSVTMKELTKTYPCQYLADDKRTNGRYYRHNGTNTTDNENTSTYTPIRVFEGVPYSFINVYAYFCTLVFDDGTTQALSEATTTALNIYFNEMPKNGWAYITIYNTNVDTAMMVAGDSNYSGAYFTNFGVNPEKFPASSLIVENELLALGDSSNIVTWGAQSYVINGNEITYTAPASGNTGFCLVPKNRINVKKVLAEINVESITGGQMTAHIWDRNTVNFAEHLYTLSSFTSSAKLHIDLEAVAQARPSLDLRNWVLLISNSGNSFTFVFSSVSVKNDEGVPPIVDGYTLGNIFKNIYDMTDRTPLIVECGQGRQFTRLRDAISFAERVRGSTVLVYAGTYDLTQEFATEIASGTGMVGIALTNDVYVKFLSGSYVKALFPVSSQWISTNFQPFYSAGSGFTLDGLNIEASNCRYCVHDERNGQDVTYHNVYKNCKMKFTMDDPEQSHGTRRYIQCIGGGLGKHGYIEIDGGEYTTVNNLAPDHQEPITYHNGVLSGCDSKIFIKDVMLTDKGILRFGCYGTSTIKTPVYVCGCSMYDTIYKMYEVPSEYMVDNFSIIEWNNTYRA